MIRIGVIGCGYWGPNLIRNFSHLKGSDVLMCSDLSEERLAHMRSLYPKVETTTDYRRVLSRSDVDAIGMIALAYANRGAMAVEAGDDPAAIGLFARTSLLAQDERYARDSRDLHALHLYVVRIDPDDAGADRDAYQRALAEENIGTSIHFLPVHTLTYYRERFPDQAPLPVAERAGREVLSLPLSPAHSDEDIADAVDALRRVHARFTT